MARGFKTIGRQMGSSNKISSNLREKISKVVGMELEGLTLQKNNFTIFPIFLLISYNKFDYIKFDLNQNK
jgi:hypothetical protein